ncbi:hypothetical protein BDQ12DRAFT_775069 [Crucibulum laeve]|uniref:TauD/TfdA-like domain-containing protein n=1 Tax=Crucibulum laeve TaxID=68775 RepID=A0A5C3LIU6_9AGAR|nr:hypothetical protein BDQ12DRAFT_775069 [Crucibulum laeve]
MAPVAVDQVTDLLKQKLDISDVKASLTAPVVASNSVKIEAPKQPDIEYHPNEEKWNARTARRLAEDPSLPQTPLPKSFPQKLDSPLVWEGSDWKDESEWVYNLSKDELKEIDDAVKHFHSLGKPLGHISQSTFPLPALGPVLANLARELHTGRGFFVLRTIPVASYSHEDNFLIYAGVSSYVGELRGLQDKDGGVLAHIKDLSQTHPAKTIGAPAYTTDKQVYHTDIGDIISLFALEVAAHGGTSRISSSWRVYNELAAKRPDLIKTLAEPWPLDGFHSFGGDPPYTLRPLLFHHDSKIIIQYARRLFTGFLGLPRSTDIPPITEAQAEALDAIHFLGEQEALGLNFQKGDIQYINNLSVFHARDGFVDTPEKTRHLLRLWLRNEELAWKIPPELETTWKRLYYSVTPDEQRFPAEPEIRAASKGGGAKYA